MVWEKELLLAKIILPPHNPVLTMIGASMLWVGWFGFIGGSALAADLTASKAILVTHIAAAIGSLSWIAIEWFRFGKPSFIGIVTGMVAGLATITPASGFVGVPGGTNIGPIRRCHLLPWCRTYENKDENRRQLRCFAVHGIGGIIGTILCGYLLNAGFGGVGYDEDMSAVDHVKV